MFNKPCFTELSYLGFKFIIPTRIKFHTGGQKNLKTP